MATVTKPIVLDETGKKIQEALEGIRTELSGKRIKIYGFHVDGTESDPDSMITYLEPFTSTLPVGLLGLQIQ